MKKLTTALLGAALLLSPAAFAQNEQLPNSGFEDGWADCTPWTSNGTKKQGTTPAPWCISNVAGMQGSNLSFLNGSGSTTTGEQVEGYNSAKAVKVYNAENSVAKSQVVPGYFTLGKSWSTALGADAKNKDGGTFGGIEFTKRPDALEFMYKSYRVPKASENEKSEKATVIAYLWKGEWKQANVPGNIGLQESGIKKVDMIDRDRNILWKYYKKYHDKDIMEGVQGGDTTKTENAELIAVAEISLYDTNEEWALCHVDFKYFSDNIPEKFNVIFSAGDYFNSGNLVKNNSLTVDDVKLIYYNEKKDYEGYLNIEMFGGPITSDQISTVKIGRKSSSICDFTLPDFAIDLGSGPAPLGDIVVPNVNITEENGVRTYEGSVTGLKLAEGGIIANATVKGTIDAYNNVNMEIPVIWTNGGNVPINVTFSTVRKNAPEVPAILLDGVAPEGDNFDAANKEITFPEVKDVEIYYSLKEGSTTTEPANAPANVPAGYTKYDGNPLTIEANKQYTLTYIAKDTKTGLESEPKTVSFSTTVGIAAIEAENGTAEYFTLQGVRVAEPTNGIYIRVANGKATKVTVK